MQTGTVNLFTVIIHTYALSVGVYLHKDKGGEPMKNEKLRQFLAEAVPDAIILDDPAFDHSIIGVTENQIIYDFKEMIHELWYDEKMRINKNTDTDEIVDFIEYNVLRAIPYMGENKPIIMYDYLFEKY